MRRHKLLILLVSFILLLSFGFDSNAQDIPTGVPIGLKDILSLSQSIGGFLILAGSILAGIVIIVSGLTYFFAGSNPQKVKTAKDILKGGIIGAFIIFGVGVIINTIKVIATNPLNFFK